MIEDDAKKESEICTAYHLKYELNWIEYELNWSKAKKQ